MLPMNHPDYVYRPWSPERRALASERAKARLAMQRLELTMVIYDKRDAPLALRRLANLLQREMATPAEVRLVDKRRRVGRCVFA
jgi:hypothetical protein